MKERDIAKLYANSIINLASNEGFDLISELEKFVTTLNTSNQLECVFFLDAFTENEKLDVLADISSKIGLHKIMKNFFSFLITEKRMNLFSIIYKEIIIQDDLKKGLIRGTIEGSEAEIDEAVKSQLKNYLKEKLGKEPELDYKKSDKITAGYRVKVDDYLLDASLDNQLENFKKTIMF